MKKQLFYLTTFVFAALFTACTNELDEWQAQDNSLQNATELRAATRTTISLMAELNAYTLNNTNGIEQISGRGYYWNQTYTDTKFATANFTFSHTGGVQSGYNYWDGFTVSNIADTTRYGRPVPPGTPLPHPPYSEPWITKQWGCMAVPTGTSPRPNFLVGYWGYYMKDFQNPITSATNFGENKYSNWVKLGNNTQTYTVSSIKVAMHPWPYYGILYGDGFARKFVSGDHFDLIIYGVKANGKFVTNSSGKVKSITHKLADYTGSSLIMPDTWTDIFINFGQPVKYLVFQMKSTDEDPVYGPNTAVYFCLRDIVMH